MARPRKNPGNGKSVEALTRKQDKRPNRLLAAGSKELTARYSGSTAEAEKWLHENDDSESPPDVLIQAPSPFLLSY
jgi:hypothetical protein